MALLNDFCLKQKAQFILSASFLNSQSEASFETVSPIKEIKLSAIQSQKLFNITTSIRFCFCKLSFFTVVQSLFDEFRNLCFLNGLRISHFLINVFVVSWKSTLVCMFLFPDYTSSII